MTEESQDSSNLFQERGFQKKRTSSGNVYLGLSLNPEAAGDF